MCGIAGYKCFNSNRPSKEKIEELFIGIMDRGKDASGAAWIDETRRPSLKVIKDGVKVEDFLRQESWQEVEQMPRSMILHARASTQGSPKDNRNNHPIYNKRGMALVHNGIIRNDDALIKKEKFEMDGKVDSEVILRLIQNGWWKSIKELDKLSGSFSCAFLYEERPDDLILVRSSNPLAYHMDVEDDILYFASTTDILKSALAEYHRGFRTKGTVCYEFADDHSYLVGGNGIEKIQKVSTRFVACNDWGQNDKSWFGNNDNKSKKTNNASNFKKYTCDSCKQKVAFVYLVDGFEMCWDCRKDYTDMNPEMSTMKCGHCDTLLTASEALVGYCKQCLKNWTSPVRYYGRGDA